MDRVVDIVGKFCITFSDGEVLADKQIQKLAKGEKLVYDFADVEIYSTAFFKGFLMTIHSEKNIKQSIDQIELVNLSDFGKKVYSQVIKSFWEKMDNPISYPNLERIVSTEIKTL